MPMPPAALAAALAPYGVAPDPALMARLAHYLELVAAGQRRARLVGDAAPEALAARHLGESLYLGQLLDLSSMHRLVDLGSGAGFPGLALAIAWPNLKTTLVESTQKKAAFLEQAVAALGLTAQVEVWPHFLPRHPPQGRAPLAAADLLTVRALDKMAELPSWLWRWLDPTTRAAFWLTAPTAELWRQNTTHWHWGSFSPLPGAESRGLQLAIVSRGTPSPEPSLTPNP
ncbi:MAG TPA: RsmG family class I SAM-dependent methyltransferase [Terriglobales bacterium]|nr:RsmG family class I SAM-dependent methyltransferase [Terriglobales bacterium]